jgi:hypothetical protein
MVEPKEIINMFNEAYDTMLQNCMFNAAVTGAQPAAIGNGSSISGNKNPVLLTLKDCYILNGHRFPFIVDRFGQTYKVSDYPQMDMYWMEDQNPNGRAGSFPEYNDKAWFTYLGPVPNHTVNTVGGVQPRAPIVFPVNSPQTNLQDDHYSQYGQSLTSMIKPIDKKCVCGSEAVGSPKHSHWCEKYE